MSTQRQDAESGIDANQSLDQQTGGRTLNEKDSQMTLAPQQLAGERSLAARASEMTLSPHRLAGEPTLTERASEETLSSHRPQIGNKKTLKRKDSETTLSGHHRPTTDESSHDGDVLKTGEPACPDGGYGWVVVFCVFLINAHTWGLNSSYGVFLAHFTSVNTYPDATVLDFSFIAGLSVGGAMFLAPLANFVARKYGTRTAIVIGTLFETVALITSSFTTRVWQLYLSQGVCFSFGQAFLFISSVGLVPQWFDKKRGFANAISTGGSGLGGLIYNLACNTVIEKYGFQWAYRMIGLAAFVTGMIAALLIRDRNKALGANLQLWSGKMFKRVEFLFLLGWGWFNMLGYLVLVYTLPTYATSIGLTAAQGSIVGAIFNLGQGVGRPIIGLFSDRMGRINMALTMTFLCGLFSLVWWTFSMTYSVLIAFALFVGFIAGIFWATVGPVTSEVTGLKDLAPALTMTWITIALPILFSEAIALEIRQHVGFEATQLYTGFCYVAAAACLIPVRVWKIGDRERAAAAEKSSAGVHDIAQDEINPAGSGRSSLVKRLFSLEIV